MTGNNHSNISDWLINQALDRVRRLARTVLALADQLERAKDPRARIAAAARLYVPLRDMWGAEVRNALLSVIAAERVRAPGRDIPWKEVHKITSAAGSDLSENRMRQGVGVLNGTLGTNAPRCRAIKNALTRDYLTRRLIAGVSYAQIAADLGVAERTVSNYATRHGVAHLNQNRR